MRSVIPTAAAPATAAFVAAFLMQASPAAAQRICGGTPVEVSVRVLEKRHAQNVAWALWSNCTRRHYGEEWARLAAARAKNGPLCYDVRAWRRYYNNNGVVTCPGGDVRFARWVCFYRATPCRYRSDGSDDD